MDRRNERRGGVKERTLSGVCQENGMMRVLSRTDKNKMMNQKPFKYKATQTAL